MERGTPIKIAEGNFPFHFWIAKASAVEEDGRMVVEGVASTLNVDHDKERMSVEALKSMANIINTTGVPLRVEHSQNDNAIIGSINKAWIDERNQLWIKAVLDEKHPAAGILYKGLKEGVKMGLSVGGYVRRAVQEMVEGLGKQVNTFYDVLLDEVSVTQKPSNYDARLMAKSFAKSEGELDALTSAFERDEFLFHSAMGAEDYMQAISKSVKESDWQDVRKGDYKLIDKGNSMEDKDTEKTTKKADDTEETTKARKSEETDETKKSKEDESEEMSKAVTHGEFRELVQVVGKMGNAFTDALGKMAKAMGDSAMDQHQPDEKKEDPEEGKSVDKSSGGEAVDQRQPTEDKEDPESGKTVKAKEDGTDEEGSREKARKADKEDTYDLETVERAIKRIKSVSDSIGKAADETEEKTTKAEETETETRKSVKLSSIDEFVVTVADTIERMEKSMKESGFQTNHIARTMINQMRSNPEFRKDIAALMSEPGKKHSVVNGTPFVKMKDGRTFALTLSDTQAERTEKSSKEEKPKDFKSLWGLRFSSTQSE